MQDLRHKNSAKYFWLGSGDSGRAAGPLRKPIFEGRFEAEKLCNKCAPKNAAILTVLGIPVFFASAIQGFSGHPVGRSGTGLGCPDFGGFLPLSGASLPSPMGLRIRLRFRYNSNVRFQAAKIGQFGFQRLLYVRWEETWASFNTLAGALSVRRQSGSVIKG
jgi:hypothetical protein